MRHGADGSEIHMGLFDEQVMEVRRFMREMRDGGRLREFEAQDLETWPLGSTLVLEEDTAIELGNPRIASLSMLVWAGAGDVADGRVSIVGPDMGEATEKSLPLGQVLIAGGEFPNEYDSYRDIRDAVYDTHLEGFSVRTMPSRRTVWCRASRDAVGAGFSLAHLGAAFIEALSEVPGVESVEALFVTSSAQDVTKLSTAARGAQRLVEAMMKMYQEQNFDCETCEYADVCDTVMDLKKIRKKLADEKAV
jgi:CO dehydrogenase/acetyl-CoA synthase beta subunit